MVNRLENGTIAVGAPGSEMRKRAEAKDAAKYPTTHYETMAQAETAAIIRNKECGQLFMACDRGFGRWPRYVVAVAPKVGDFVSYTFNGDYYPAGTIIRISTSGRRIETSNGTVFWRNRASDQWISNGTWSMIAGHHDRRSREF